MEELFQRPILIWSEYCNYSKNFINALLKHNDLYESFIRINIDTDQKTNRRPQIFYQIQTALKFKIKQVPTIIVNNGEYILSGVEAFKWLDYMINKNNVVKEDLQGFNPIEMGSFSDSYAKYGSTKLHDATEQSFKFLNKDDQKIETPAEEGVLTQEEMLARERQREKLDTPNQYQQNGKINMEPKFVENFTNSKKMVDLSQYNSDRNNVSFMPKVANSRIDFTNDSFGFAGELNNNMSNNNVMRGLSRGETKQKEIDVKLQRLLAERDSSVPPMQQRYG